MPLPRIKKAWIMDQTLFELTVAFIMVTVIAVLFGWFRRTETTASTRRMIRMMLRARVDHRIPAHTNPNMMAIMKSAQRRCARCPSEDYCERWLAGEVEAPNTFCPNASVFQGLAEPTG